ncbi:MAG: hypothetical protein UY13_C0002G0375 [Candidatus Pacebacteria bacterium GW2011_GWB1_47_8]|nr:MAG: hypothetical protein UX28_C0001G0522 [Candidatus Pacebacteria bacterium GW2011_GWA1_46_10]KKU84463.1 MAG: hypothetical protein UY13_C0002G0375 [Candidatus Pacebacteria bacterium GW2011_GWB1_47_8]HCR81106.1 hypothetical protein [Candidatus Paceibacterota bacterium]
MKIVSKLFVHPETLLFTGFLVLFSFGQLQRIQLTKDIAIYGHDILITYFVLWQLLTNSKLRQVIVNTFHMTKKIILTHQLEAAWVTWVIGGMIAGGLTGRVTVRGWLYLGRLLMYLAFIVLIKQNKRTRYSPRIGLAVVSVLIAGWGLLQYALMPDVRWLNIFGWDNHYYRLISTLFDPAFTGILLVIGFGLWQLPTVLPQLSVQLKRAIQLILTVALAATFSRASYLGFLVLNGFFLLTKKIKLSFVAIVITVFWATLFLLPKPGGEGVNLARTSTGEARLINAQENLIKLNGAQWLWGRGLFNTDAAQAYQTPSHAQLPDSLPVLLTNSLGLGGVWLTLTVLIKWLKNWWQTKPVWTGLLLTVLIHSLFNNTFFQPFVFLALWLAF